jgi:hypothetical protein
MKFKMLMHMNSASWNRSLGRRLCLALALSQLGFGVFAQAGLQYQGGEYLPAGRAVGDQTHPALAVGISRSALVWQENTDGDGNAIKVRLLGAQFSGLTAATYANTTTVGDQENASCVTLPNGDFFLAWQSGLRGAQRIIGRILGNDGVFRTGEIEISAGSGARSPKVVANQDSSITVVWTQAGVDSDMDAVLARTLNPAGIPQTPPTQLNLVESYNQRDAVAVALGDGSLFIAWISENPNGTQVATVVGRKFNPALVATSGEITLTPGKNPCVAPALVKMADRIMLAWGEFQIEAPENGWDLMAKPLTFNGAPLASARRITAKQTGDQGDLSLVSNGETILAAFSSTLLDGSGLGIGIQQLGVDGTPADFDLVANTTKRQNQVRPALAIGPSGAALAAWVGFGSAESGTDLFAQRIGKSEAALPAPNAPIAVALSSSKIRVACAEVAGLPISKYLIFVDGSPTPTESSSPFVSMGGFAPETEHRFSVAYRMLDGRVTPQSSEQVAVTWGEDDNADGLPDSWQAKYFGSIVSSWPLAGADSDGDGNSNRDEFLAGTNPADGSSALRTSLENTQLGTLLAWNTLPGGLYQIQASSDLVNWTDVGGIRLASGTRESVLVQDAPVNSYFRVTCLR